MKDDKDKMDVPSAVRWNAAATWGKQLIRFVTMIIMVRILTPESFGLLAMAMVVTGFVDKFRNLGFIQVIIQRKELSEELLSSLFYVILAIACLMAAGVTALSPVFSWVYGEPQVAPIIAVLSLTFIISALARVQLSLLTREMAFRRLAVITTAGAVLMDFITILLALCGWGVWSLVWGSLVGSSVRMILLYVACPWRPQLLFRWSEVRGCLAFGLNLTGYSMFNYFARNADKFIIGAFLGAVPLGFYSTAARFLRLPQDAISRVLGRVLFPAFSKMQSDDARLKSVYLRSCGAIAIISFPMMLGLLVTARPFVEVVLGAQWLPSVPLLIVLSLVGLVQSVQMTVEQLFMAKGRADWMFRWGIVSGIFLICGLAAGVPWGILGVTVAYALATLVLLIPSFWIPFKLVEGLNLRELFKTLAPYACCSIAMALLVAGCRSGLEYADAPTNLVFAACVAVGVISYMAMILWSQPRALDDAKTLLGGRLARAGHQVGAGRAS